MESKAVLENECVMNLTRWVNELTPWYDRMTNYIYDLENSTNAEQLKQDIEGRKRIVNDINITLATAAEINKKVEGQYAKVRDAVNKAIKEKTSEVTITAIDRDYGGCTVSMEDAQAILDEMQDQKNKAELMVDYIYHAYNDILVPKFGSVFKPAEKAVNTHCVEDTAYYARKNAYDNLFSPMTDYLYKLKGKDEGETHYKLRKWLRDNGAVYASNTLQTFTDAMYEAILSGDSIKRNMIADNCYKSLTEAEYKWVEREVDVRIKKDSVDVYKIPNRPLHFERVTRLLLRLLFGYGYYKNQLYSEYIGETQKFIDELDINDMKLLVAIPETCIFTFPTDTQSEYIQTVTVNVIKHCINYNQNWDLDAAYMYWFWTWLEGKEYGVMKNQEGNDVQPPTPRPEPFDYFNGVFKLKLKKIADATGRRLVGTNGLLIDGTYDHATAKLMAPWISSFFPDNTYDFGKRSQFMDALIDQAKECADVYQFVEWIHNDIMLKVPLEVVKSFNAISGLQYLTKVPISFVPNNFSFFDKEYEFETGYLTVLNSMYWTYGYICDENGNQLTSKPTHQSQVNYVQRGGMCYQTGIDPAEFSTARYDPFKLIWNPEYNGTVRYTRKESPLTDLKLINVNGLWYYNWSTAQHSYLVQDMTTKPRPIGANERIPYIGAECIMLPYKSFILDKLVKRYIDTEGCMYASGTYNKNPWLFTFADYVADNHVRSNRLIHIMFNEIVKRLLRCHISFPYNNILSTNFINSVHFNWHKINLPTDGADTNWSRVILPQYIFSDSATEAKFRNPRLDIVHMSKDQGGKVELEEYSCQDFNLTQCGSRGLNAIEHSSKL